MSSAEVIDTIMAEVPAPPSISEAAHQYQLAMSSQQEAPQPNSSIDANSSAMELGGDSTINGNAPEASGSPVHAASTSAANAPSPAPLRTGTPVRRENGPDVSSRAASQHPDPVSTMPAEAPPHGAPTRLYLNSKVTGVLLEGMKLLAKEQPKDPLRVLGEFLVQRSRELEGT